MNHTDTIALLRGIAPDLPEPVLRLIAMLLDLLSRICGTAFSADWLQAEATRAAARARRPLAARESAPPAPRRRTPYIRIARGRAGAPRPLCSQRKAERPRAHASTYAAGARAPALTRPSYRFALPVVSKKCLPPLTLCCVQFVPLSKYNR